MFKFYQILLYFFLYKTGHSIDSLIKLLICPFCSSPRALLWNLQSLRTRIFLRDIRKYFGRFYFDRSCKKGEYCSAQWQDFVQIRPDISILPADFVNFTYDPWFVACWNCTSGSSRFCSYFPFEPSSQRWRSSSPLGVFEWIKFVGVSRWLVLCSEIEENRKWCVRVLQP